MPRYAVRVEVVEFHTLEVHAPSAEKAKAMVEEAEHFYQFLEDHQVRLYVGHEVGEAWEVKDEQIS